MKSAEENPSYRRTNADPFFLSGYGMRTPLPARHFLFSGKVLQQFSVGGKELGFGYKADVFPSIYYR